MASLQKKSNTPDMSHVRGGQKKIFGEGQKTRFFKNHERRMDIG